MAKDYTLRLSIESADQYKQYLEEITFDWARTSDNIGYHFTYLHYLYQVHSQVSLPPYKMIDALRIKTIIIELASIAELLLFDAICNLSVVDEWGRKTYLMLDPKVGFTVILAYAYQHKVINKDLKGRLHKLFELRHMVHLTHGGRDPDQFTTSLLKDSEKTVEDLVKHFLTTRRRGRINIDASELPFPWKK